MRIRNRTITTTCHRLLHPNLSLHPSCSNRKVQDGRPFNWIQTAAMGSLIALPFQAMSHLSRQSRGYRFQVQLYRTRGCLSLQSTPKRMKRDGVWASPAGMGIVMGMRTGTGSRVTVIRPCEGIGFKAVVHDRHATIRRFTVGRLMLDIIFTALRHKRRAPFVSPSRLIP